MAMENSTRLLPLIKEFLDNETIPFMKWVNKEQQIWQLPWKHHRPTRWGEPDAYMLCEIARKMYNFRRQEPQPEELKMWKERLRNALRSLGVKELEKLRQQDGENPIKVYQFSNSPVNGRKSKGKRRSVNSPPKVQATLPFNQFDTELQPQPPVLDQFTSFSGAAFRSRSPVNEFNDIDTDGFSGNLDSIPAITAQFIYSAPAMNICVRNPVLREIPILQTSHDLLYNNFSNIPCAGSKPNTVDTRNINGTGVCSEVCPYQELEQLINDVNVVGVFPQLGINDIENIPTGNIPTCVNDNISNDSCESPETIDMPPLNFLSEPSLMPNNVLDCSDAPCIVLSVKYLNQTVVSERISEQSVKLCYVPDSISRETIRYCPTPEQFGPSNAKLVELPCTDTCPGINKNSLELIQKILNHMERGVTFVYKGDDIFAKRLCKAVPYYTVPTENHYKKLERGTEVKIFDFKNYFVPEFEKKNKPTPYVSLTFSVRNPEKVKTPILSVDIWHMKANELIQTHQEMTQYFNHLEPDCSLSNEFDTRLRIEHSLQC
ncbi:interferon regulatory factor 7 [Biomphalaria pfeifferi]|uniref:Interferon regulatory factor 7 n=1 Tax=Biomphalaria pfeifferi TaxID=112525 RepID=A0AAD8BT72_BIOPF|nr:interferon regulatory factor 7 [Biomphalaria pfeifferi]